VTGLEAALADYLRLRRALGHKLDDAGRQLARFVTYLDFTGAEAITMRAVLEFVTDPDAAATATVAGRRLTAVRGFARYLAAIDGVSVIPPAGMVASRVRHRIPHIFSDADVAAVIARARAAVPAPFRQETVATLTGLLAVTGMRVGEALRLGRGDVGWDAAVIQVRGTKFGKGRDIPVSESTITALQAYARQRDQRKPATTRLFVSLAGTPVAYSNFSLTFRAAVTAAGIGAGTGIRPRIHDLRHSFAVRTLLGWHQAGLDAEALLPRLSTYLGHREPRFTYRYLTATPELLALAAARLEDAREGLTP
jgi:integrase/recombinase XerD